MLIAVSSCLLGNRVRYDGRHKAHDFVLRQLAQYCDYKPLCPEDKAFGTPRPTIHVEYEPQTSGHGLSVIESSQQLDVTAPLSDVIEKYIRTLTNVDISGVILKAKSPSCGYGSTPIFKQGVHYDTANGLFADALLKAFPELPIIEETGFLNDWQREQFLIHLFAYADMQQHQTIISQLDEFRSFHARHALLLGLKDSDVAVQLNDLVSNANKENIGDMTMTYMAVFKRVMATSVTKEACANVLSSILSEASVSDDERRRNIRFIEEFKNGQQLLLPVTTLLKESLSFEQSKLLKSSLLNPYPEELATRTN